MSILHIRQITPTETGISATLQTGQRLQIDFAEDWLLRVAIVPATGLAADRTWMVAPEVAPEKEPPLGGRNRLSLAGFTCPTVTHSTANTHGDSHEKISPPSMQVYDFHSNTGMVRVRQTQ